VINIKKDLKMTRKRMEARNLYSLVIKKKKRLKMRKKTKK
jgi:hypothetical protein